MNNALKIGSMVLLTAVLGACERSQPATPATIAAEPATATTSTPSADSAAPAPAGDLTSLDESVAGGKILSQEGVGIVAGGVLTSTGKEGFLAFGPYAPFAAGDYTATVIGSIAELPAGTTVTLDAVSSSGTQNHGTHAIGQSQPQPGELAKFDFSLSTAVTDLEIRVNVPEGSKVVLQSYKVSKR